MRIKGLTDEDFLQYREPSMFIIFPTCNFKCDIENGSQICQNWGLMREPIIDVNKEKIIQRYITNDITNAIVMGGLEPLDSFSDVLSFITSLRNDYKCDDTVVIYTGYKEEEVIDIINELKQFKNIIIKFGRFVPGQEPHQDPLLGVALASDNQYAVQIS